MHFRSSIKSAPEHMYWKAVMPPHQIRRLYYVLIVAIATILVFAESFHLRLVAALGILATARPWFRILTSLIDQPQAVAVFDPAGRWFVGTMPERKPPMLTAARLPFVAPPLRSLCILFLLSLVLCIGPALRSVGLPLAYILGTFLVAVSCVLVARIEDWRQARRLQPDSPPHLATFLPAGLQLDPAFVDALEVALVTRLNQRAAPVWRATLAQRLDRAGTLFVRGLMVLLFVPTALISIGSLVIAQWAQGLQFGVFAAMLVLVVWGSQDQRSTSKPRWSWPAVRLPSIPALRVPRLSQAYLYLFRDLCLALTLVAMLPNGPAEVFMCTAVLARVLYLVPQIGREAAAKRACPHCKQMVGDRRE